jgi:hypothetical protein
LAIDGTANGCVLLPYGGTNPSFPNWPNYQSNQNYNAGDRVQPNSGNPANCVFQATNTGAKTAAPTWANTEAGNGTFTNFCHIGQTVASATITWKNVGFISPAPGTAIFDPGLYYLGGTNGLSIKQATVRTSTAAGDGTKGVMFYFSSTGTVTVTANAGKSPACTSAQSGATAPNSCIVSYKIDGSNSSAATGSVTMRALQCPGGDPNPVSGSLDGDILLGPCSGTYGSSDGKNRGFLFFQARSNSATPNWGGGGQFLLSGFMYFHSNSNGGTCGTNTTCLSMDGGSGSGSYTLGNLVADQVHITGNSGITMILNPKVTFQVLRPTLLE